jgi:hypothetical protein
MEIAKPNHLGSLRATRGLVPHPAIWTAALSLFDPTKRYDPAGQSSWAARPLAHKLPHYRVIKLSAAVLFEKEVAREHPAPRIERRRA